VTCSGAGGFGSDTVTITTRQNPDLSTPLIGRTPSAGFTTTYDSLAIYFQTGNIGGSDITVNAAYTLEYDSNNDGSYDTTRTGTLGTLAVGQYVTRTETFTNVPFGTIKARVTVDYTDVITEVNETDNVGTLNDTLPPPDPGLTFTSDRIQVRHNEKANLNWSLSTPYSGITCQVYGPNININPVTVPSSVETAAIPAKSEFTFKCTEGVSGTTWIKTIWVETVGEIEEI
jgi:hypothetical protein